MAASVQFFYHFRVMLLNAENNNIMIGAYEANREIKTRFGTLRYTLRYIIMIVIIIIIIITYITYIRQGEGTACCSSGGGARPSLSGA